MLLRSLSHSDKSVGLANIFHFLRAASRNSELFQNLGPQDCKHGLVSDFFRVSSWHARDKCLGKYSHRKDGQRAFVRICGLCSVISDVVPDQLLLHHFRLLHFLGDHKRNDEEVLCTDGVNAG